MLFRLVGGEVCGCPASVQAGTWPPLPKTSIAPVETLFGGMGGIGYLTGHWVRLVGSQQPGASLGRVMGCTFMASILMPRIFRSRPLPHSVPTQPLVVLRHGHTLATPTTSANPPNSGSNPASTLWPPLPCSKDELVPSSVMGGVARSSPRPLEP